MDKKGIEWKNVGEVSDEEWEQMRNGRPKKASRPGKWRPFADHGTAIDEYTGEAIGLFGPSGYCWLGVEVRRSPYQPSFGLIAFNRQCGVWLDSEPTNPLSGLDVPEGRWNAAVVLLTWFNLVAWPVLLVSQLIW